MSAPLVLGLLNLGAKQRHGIIVLFHAGLAYFKTYLMSCVFFTRSALFAPIKHTSLTEYHMHSYEIRQKKLLNCSKSLLDLKYVLEKILSSLTFLAQELRFASKSKILIRTNLSETRSLALCPRCQLEKWDNGKCCSFSLSISFVLSAKFSCSLQLALAHLGLMNQKYGISQ